jgi:urease accessory protein UreF
MPATIDFARDPLSPASKQDRGARRPIDHCEIGQNDLFANVEHRCRFQCFFGSFWRAAQSHDNVQEVRPVASPVDVASRPNTSFMLDQTNNLSESASEILGDLAALAEQLGHPDGLCTLPAGAVSAAFAPVRTATELKKFLREYTSQVLLAQELPVIADAYGHVTRYEVRELIALDKSMAERPGLQAFTNASQRIGQTQLLRLRPLRGERVVQRYANAVQAGEAHAWHTLVFGLVLAVYSFPLRQGLIHFSQQTLTGFARALANRLRLTSAQINELWAAQSSLVQTEVETILQKQTVRR